MLPICKCLNENSITGNIKSSCCDHFWRKTLIFFLVFLVAWSFTKVPYYIGFDPNGDTPLTSSINLYHWVKGYQGSKSHSPACNFFLLHIAFGSTVLIMMALTMIKTAWRKKYGNYFFTFASLLGVHTIPAAWEMNDEFLKYLFTLTCVGVIVSSLFGYRTLKNYDQDPVLAEKALAWEYGMVTFFTYGAGYAEGAFIVSKLIYKAQTGNFRDYGSTPDPKFGHSLYDKLPESVGLTLFFVWVAIFWFWWPIKLVKINTTTDASKHVI